MQQTLSVHSAEYWSQWLTRGDVIVSWLVTGTAFWLRKLKQLKPHPTIVCLLVKTYLRTCDLCIGCENAGCFYGRFLLFFRNFHTQCMPIASEEFEVSARRRESGTSWLRCYGWKSNGYHADWEEFTPQRVTVRTARGAPSPLTRPIVGCVSEDRVGEGNHSGSSAVSSSCTLYSLWGAWNISNSYVVVICRSVARPLRHPGCGPPVL